MKPAKITGMLQPKQFTIVRSFKLSSLFPYLPQQAGMDQEWMEDIADIQPSSFGLDSFADVVQEHLCMIMNDNREYKLMLKVEALEYHTTQIQPGLVQRVIGPMKKTQESMVKSSIRNSPKTPEMGQRVTSPLPVETVPLNQDLTSPKQQSTKENEVNSVQQKSQSDKDAIIKSEVNQSMENNTKDEPVEDRVEEKQQQEQPTIVEVDQNANLITSEPE